MEISNLRSEIEPILNNWEIRYSMVWEDFRCLEQACAFQPEGSVLAIGSAGCNALNTLLKVAKVHVVDLNPAQLALIDLKRIAIEHLNYEEVIQLLGLESGPSHQIYKNICHHLPRSAQKFFNENQKLLDLGLFRCGKLEQFFSMFRKEFLPKTSPMLLSPQWLSRLSHEQQFVWLETLDWQSLQESIAAYFDFKGLTRGRSPEQMKYVTSQNVAYPFYLQFKQHLYQGRIAENFYLFYFLTGQLPEKAFWPDYLQPQNFSMLKKKIKGLKLYHQSLEQFFSISSQAYSSMILSDIFEYMSPEQSEQLMKLLSKYLMPQGRIAFWNLLVDRKAPSDTFRFLQEQSLKAMEADRLWFYQNFQAYERI